MNEVVNGKTKIIKVKINKMNKQWFENLRDSGIVKAIHIYRNSFDAALEGHYMEDDDPGYMVEIESPNMVIELKNGTEYWVNGASCGYYGSGTCNSIRFFQKHGIIGATEVLEKNEIIHVNGTSGSWIVQTEKSYFADLMRFKNDMNKIFIDLISYDKKLVMIIRQREVLYNNIEISITSEFVNKCLQFLGEYNVGLLLTRGESVKTRRYLFIDDHVSYCRKYFINGKNQEVWLMDAITYEGYVNG